MPRRLPSVTALVSAGTLIGVAVLGAGCASGHGESGGPPSWIATDFKAAQIRQLALFVRVKLAREWTGRDKTARAEDYEGLLLEGFNARAVLVMDVRNMGDGPLDRAGALARTREVGADHALLVEARAARETVTVCQETGRQRRGEALVWHQSLELMRASDGAARVQLTDSPALGVTDLEVDCESGRARSRRLADVMGDAVEKLLSRLLGP